MTCIKNISLVPRDLADGRVLAPGEVVEDVELTDHERGQVEGGHLLVVDKQGRRKSVASPSNDDQQEEGK